MVKDIVPHNCNKASPLKSIYDETHDMHTLLEEIMASSTPSQTQLTCLSASSS